MIQAGQRIAPSKIAVALRDNDYWWLEFHLLNVCNEALAATDLLSAGLNKVLVGLYSVPVPATVGPVTRDTAHFAACALALDVTGRAWSAVRRKIDGKDVDISILLTIRRPACLWSPEYMSPKHLRAEAHAVLSYFQFDSQEILARINWENVKAKQSIGASDAAAADAEFDSALSASEARILRCLLKQHPQCMTQEVLSRETDRDVKTIRPALRRLRALGYTDRPHGDRGGEALTLKGRSIAERLPNLDPRFPG